ncbi:STAS domain-containing protein [Flexilinea flocculi]|jgi:anti-sigma B factor antagonist|uniref:Anti-sigma factor antagonist n=1 Tax=Flexilinea flocculi TaxID=1678840 RepID=A0A0S7BST0_9CHLR|nr:STAS domain-containing protein [Flexilinea flocculi]GAP41579.1 anti-anti-sigma factor [Flexilinea flocculi]
MEIHEMKEGNKLSITLSGRLDTITAPDLENKLNSSLDNINELIFDFSALSYLSSAGLRVLLSAQKRMNRQGSLVIHGVNETIMEIFEATGFTDILKIE